MTVFSSASGRPVGPMRETSLDPPTMTTSGLAELPVICPPDLTSEPPVVSSFPEGASPSGADESCRGSCVGNIERSIGGVLLRRARILPVPNGRFSFVRYGAIFPRVVHQVLNYCQPLYKL